MWTEEAETKQNLQRWSSVLREFNKPDWADVVQSVASRPVVTTRSGSRGQYEANSLIDRSELNDHIVAAFGPGFLDTPYIWDIDGESEAG
jgi:hypothetical protein